MYDKFADETETKPTKNARIDILRSKLVFDEKRYQYDEGWVPADTNNPLEIHSTAELVECLMRNDKNPLVDIEARIIGVGDGEYGHVKMDKRRFLETIKRKPTRKMREAWDGFGYDQADWAGGNLVGHDYTPLLGGPFNKQLYYRDYLRMISTSFYAFNHDPAAKAVTNIMVDFTMSRGFTLHTDNEAAQAVWDAFRIANDFDQQMNHVAHEISIYGETMLWRLPNHDARISFNPQPGETVPKALIPRMRLIDPSNIAEIVTVPEDIWKGVLYYVWLAPTQYQMWTDGKQPSTKFIYNQIPADQIQHYKVNAVSNEKRGRCDFFSALGYMKRLRDSINYSIIAEQKAAAWCIDTTIAGNDSDISDYIQQQAALGQYAPAGSEFVHTEAVKREYLSNQATGKGKESPVFNWCLNMIAMATGVPVSYLGTHLSSGGSSRASALVSTEPVAKRFERRRLVYEQIIRDTFNWVTGQFGIQADCDIIFPELITQDRSAKLKDLQLSMNSEWLSHKRAAEIAAKELDIKNFDYDEEMADIKAQDSSLGIDPGSDSPLTSPGASGQDKEVAAIAAPERQQIKTNLRQI